MTSSSFLPSPHPLVEAVPAFDDNYLWLILGPEPATAGQPRPVAVVDPGDAEAINRRLQDKGYRLAAILITHHHADHIGGLAALKAQWHCRVIGPFDSRIEDVDTVVTDEQVEVPEVAARFQALPVPGHTSSHVAYYAEHLGSREAPPVLFCGDTLFAAGCGRLFEGSPAQMQSSLERLAALPGPTLVYCAHEYTLSNLRFAQAAFPGDATIRARLAEAEAARARAQSTVPSSLAIERATNPFLLADRNDCDAALTAAGQWPAGTTIDRATRFAALRAWKNVYR